MKTYLLIFFFLSSFAAVSASDIRLLPEPWIYSWPINLEIQFSEPVKKVLWTRYPDWPFDETFVYEEKIQIRHTQDLWYFWVLDNHVATDYFIWRYEIKVDPNKFKANFKISKISPKGDWVEIRNEWDFSASLHNWLITTRTWEKILPFVRMKAWEVKKFDVDLWDFMEVVRLKDPSFLTKYKFRYKSSLSENELYSREIWERGFGRIEE